MSAAIEVVRHPRARSAKLSVDPVSGVARLTLPPRAALRPAIAWAEAQAAWIAAQRARLPRPHPFVDGATLPFGDDELTIDWRGDAPRRIVHVDDRLVCGGPPEAIGRGVTAWLKRQALMLLSEDTADYAHAAGVMVARVSVGDARSRWGSCATTGTIRYSWRLVLAPVFVRRATAAHEVAHRVHMNHGAAFHTLVAELYGDDPSPARRWLRANGAALHRIGRG